jgi:NAD+ kinase
VSGSPYILLVEKGSSPFSKNELSGLRNTLDFEEKATFLTQILESRERHERAVFEVEQIFKGRGWAYDLINRADYNGPQGHNLIVTIGGDGTVLAASHKTLDIPLIGINSDPERSVGYFCAARVEGAEKTFDEYIQGNLQLFELHRLRIEIDGVTCGPPALNDVLVANCNPAATTRYTLVAGNRTERHRCSGLWISTPAGSTAGIRSAGGVVLPLHMPLLQYLVREPAISPLAHYELLRGVRNLDEGIVVMSEMYEGFIYVDGPYEKIPFRMGEKMIISGHTPLKLLGLEPGRRER